MQIPGNRPARHFHAIASDGSATYALATEHTATNRPVRQGDDVVSDSSATFAIATEQILGNLPARHFHAVASDFSIFAPATVHIATNRPSRQGDGVVVDGSAT